jgi:hypothetical protein
MFRGSAVFEDPNSTPTRRVHSAAQVQTSNDVCFPCLSLHPFCLDTGSRHSPIQRVHPRDARFSSDELDNDQQRRRHAQLWGPSSNHQDDGKAIPGGIVGGLTAWPFRGHLGIQRPFLNAQALGHPVRSSFELQGVVLGALPVIY